MKYSKSPWLWQREERVNPLEDDCEPHWVKGGELVSSPDVGFDDGCTLIETDGGYYPPYDNDRLLMEYAPLMYELLERIAVTKEKDAWVRCEQMVREIESKSV